MMVLKGYFIKVNKYGRLKFRYLGGSDYTPGKLIAATGELLGQIYKEHAKNRIMDIEDSDSDECGGSNKTITDVNVDSSRDNIRGADNSINTIHLPFDDSTFTVVMPKWIKKPPQDILSRVGLICVIEVKALKYDFTSEAKHNVGVHITGFQLVFSKVVKEIR